MLKRGLFYKILCFLPLFLTYQLCLVRPILSQSNLENNNKLNRDQRNYSNKRQKLKIEYLLGSGDILNLQFAGISPFDGLYDIDPAGNLNLPEIGKINVANLTLTELNKLLIDKYNDFIFNPDIKISINTYRPVSIYIKGEVSNPGLHILSYKVQEKSQTNLNNPAFYNPLINQIRNQDNSGSAIPPKLFDLLEEAGGVTNYADISKIRIIRQNSNKQGGGQIETTINFLDLLEKGDQSINLRLYDRDTVIIPKAKTLLADKILEIKRTNFNPEYIKVYVTGNITKPGVISVKQGTGLLQAIATAGGKKILSGKIEFLRFNIDGSTERDLFRLDSKATIGSMKNPILMEGDIVNVKRTLLGNTTQALNEISSPIITGYSLFKIFED